MFRLSLSLFFLLLFAPLRVQAGEVTSITVLADPSLTLPITEIVRAYSRDHFITVSASFPASNEQAELIRGGSESNVLITARARTVTDLTNQGLLDVYAKSSVIQDRLVLAANASTEFTVDFSQEVDLNLAMEEENPDFAFVIGDAEYTSLGGYAMAALSGLDWLKQVEPRLLVLRSSDAVREVIFVGNIGLMFLSDALNHDTLRVVTLIPEEAHPPILYQAAVIAGDNMDAARGFVSYLEGETAQEIFASYGFLPVVE